MAQTIMFIILTISFFLLPAASITFGVLASSFWVGLLTFLGILLVLMGMGEVTNDKRFSFPIEYFTIFGLAILSHGGACFIAGYQPTWIVFLTWGLIVITGVFTCDFAYKESNSLGNTAALMAIFSAPVGVALPMIIKNLIVRQPIDPAQWSWTITAGGLAAFVIAMNQALRLKTKSYSFFVVCGFVLLGLSMWLSGNLSGWWWALIWLFAALCIGYGGYELPMWRTKSGTIGIAIGLCVLVGIGTQLVSFGVIQTDWLKPTGRQQISNVEPDVTLSALDVSSTQLAAAQATATQAYIEEQQSDLQMRQTQTAQALTILQTQQEQTQSAIEASEKTQTAQQTKSAQAALTGEETRDRGPGFFSAIGGFLWMAVKSIWGLLYLLIFFLIGQTWIKKWGGVLFLGVLLLAVGYFGGRSDYHAGLYKALINSGPKTWLISIMSTSFNLTGTIGWGIVGAGIGLALLLIPGFKASIMYSQKSLQAMKIKENQGTTMFQNFLQSSGLDGRTTLAYYLYQIISPTFVIALWLALRQIANSQMAKISFLSIPNLTIPNWRPVWHISYFILGLIFMMIYVIFVRLQRAEQQDNPLYKMSIWVVIPIAVVSALLFPAGVVLFYTVILLFFSLIYPVVSFTMKDQAAQRKYYPQPEPVREVDLLAELERHRREIEEQERKRREREQEQKWLEREQERKRLEAEQEQRRLENEKEAEIKPVQPELPGRKLYQAASPIVGGTVTDDNQLRLVNQAGELFYLQNGLVLKIINLPFSSPKFSLSAKNDQMLIIGQRGEMEAFPTSLPKNPIQLMGGLEACALNGFGTLLAYVYIDNPGHLRGLFLASQKEMVFPNPGDEKIRSLAFSESGRYLGIGTEMGKLTVIDIATHNEINSIPDMGFGPLEFLDIADETHWFAAYRDGWLASWLLQVPGGAGDILQTVAQTNPIELIHGFSVIRVDKERQRVLVGDNQGYLWIYPFDLRTQEYGEKVQESEITDIFVYPDGTVVTVGAGINLRTLTGLP